MALLAAMTNRLPTEVADHYRGRDPGDIILDLRLATRGKELLARREGYAPGEVEAVGRMKNALGPYMKGGKVVR